MFPQWFPSRMLFQNYFDPLSHNYLVGGSTCQVATVFSTHPLPPLGFLLRLLPQSCLNESFPSWEPQRPQSKLRLALPFKVNPLVFNGFKPKTKNICKLSSHGNGLWWAFLDACHKLDGACSRAELSSKWHMSAKIASTRAALQSPFVGHNLTTHCYLVGNPSEKH